MRTESYPARFGSYSLLGLLSLLLVAGIIFFHTPANIYAANANDFSSPLPALFRSIVPAAAAFLVFFGVPLLLPNRGFRRLWAIIWFALAIVIWVSSSFFVLDVGPLNGRLTSIGISAAFALASIAALTAVAGGSALLAARLPRLAITAALVLNIGLIGVTITTTAKYSAVQRSPLDPTSASLFRFSSSRNVLVILLDSVQADLFDEIVTSDSGLQEDLAGFTFFPDTVAPAATTYVSLPVIHSGKPYDPTQPLARAYFQQIWRGSFLVSLAQAGYETFVLNPVESECPDKAACTISEDVLAGMRFTALQEYLRLLDLSLFRAAPAYTKRLIFNRGAWRTRTWAGDDAGDNRAYRSQRILQALASRITVDTKKPVAKFIHLFNTHPPAELNHSCEPVSPPLDGNRGTMLDQSRCAIQALAKFLDTLKAKDIYDKSVIVVVSDHGLGFESTYAQSAGSGQWRALVGRANSLLLYKPLKARGKLRRSSLPAQAGDVPAIVCTETGDCSYSGAGQNHERRLYNDYSWTNELWTAEYIPNLRTFTITGPVWSINSWSRSRPPLIKEGTPVHFAAGGGAESMLDWGWGDAEKWGVRSVGSQAALSFSVDHELRAHPVRLAANLRTLANRDNRPLTIKVSANRRQLGSWDIATQHPSGSFEVVLPTGIWPPENDSVTVRFEMDAEAGPSNENRGIGLESICLHAM